MSNFWDVVNVSAFIVCILMHIFLILHPISSQTTVLLKT